MCSLFSVGSRTSTGQVSRTVYAGIRAAAKTPLPVRSKNSNQLSRVPDKLDEIHEVQKKDT